MNKSLLLAGCMLFTFWGSVLAQQRTITGNVTSADDGSVLPGVNVVIKGTQEGTVTGMDGNYAISVTENTVLKFSYIGYLNQEIEVGDQSVINVKMAVDTKQLNEVVVTALGISKSEEKIGYAISKVDGEKLSQAREVNVANSLEGQVAGLNISGTNGGPGSSARILLRGMASFNAGSPLFVINGVPMDNSNRGSSGEWGGSDQGDGIGNLNPDDIASMTVLKGASASALYGARAANGVILITTKTGKKGGLAVEYNLNYSVDKARNDTDFQYAYGQGQHGQRPQTVSDALGAGDYSWGEKLDGASTIQWDGSSYPYSAVKDNIATFYRAGPTLTNTISASGGGDNGTFRLSLSNMDNQSILRNSGVNRNTVNLNMHQNISDKLSVDVSANYIDEKGKNRPYLSDAPMNANNVIFLATNISQTVLQPGYDVNNDGAEMTWSDDIYYTNPWFVVNQFVNNTERKRMISSITARYDFTDWLYLQGRIGYDLMNDRYFQVTPWGTAYSSDRHGSLGNLSRAQTSELNTDVLLGVQKNITQDINFDVSLGANLRKNYFESIGINGGPFVLPYFYSYNNVVSYGRSYSITKKEAQSAYYTLDLSYKNILTLTTTGRYDTYSTLPSSNRSVFTPSVSGSFVFSELTKIPALSYGKLRASYAQTSGEPGEAYITSSYYSVGSTINGITTGSFSSSLPNLFLKPFTLSEVEIGAELKFFDDRLGFDIAYFHRQTKNEIIGGSLSPTTGYSSQYIATGSTLNNGLELLVTGAPVRGTNFNWDVSFNLTTLKNKILDIYGPESNNTTLNQGTYRPLNANTALVKGLPGPQIMAYDYVRDDNGNIVIDAGGIPVQGPKVPMGSVLPNLYGGLNNEFSYKSFNVSFLIDYKYGNKILSGTNYYAMYRGLDKRTLPGREGGVVADGVLENGSPNTTNVEAQTYYQETIKRISALNVLDGSFIKLRQVTIGYTIPQRVFGKLPFEGITISLVGRNLATLMKNSDNIDPESAISSQINFSGIEGNSLPATRTYGFNVNFKFKK